MRTIGEHRFSRLSLFSGVFCFLLQYLRNGENGKNLCREEK